jgi:hypothetical protein
MDVANGRVPKTSSFRTDRVTKRISSETVVRASRLAQKATRLLGKHQAQGLAGGRPQLTTEIRAESHASKFSNLCFPASMQQLGGMGRDLEIGPRIH